jgi:GH25 family lysozyme M1 (1,4-beta-N-acetylmuramidase)
MLTPLIADMNHANPLDSAALAGTTVIGVIHKVNQGVGFVDSAYAARVEKLASLGLETGAYDFATADDVKDNVRVFLTRANLTPRTLLCLDYETNKKSPMTGDQAREFVDRVDQATGRACWLYGGDQVFEHISPMTQFADWWAQHPLWLCQYKTDPSLRDTTLSELNKHIRIPQPWKSYTALQYTGDGLGPLPHTVAGVEQGADLSAFDGTPEQLRSMWPGQSLVTT